MITRVVPKKYLIAIGVVLGVSVTLVPGVAAQTVSSLACNPSTIAGGSGGSSTCTVTLSLPAPAGGTVTTLTSSLVELAASVPRITVPAGQTTASFAVATNPNYRRYSALAFTATISATANGATRSATLNVSAQPRPPDFSSGSQAGSNTQWSGLMCGGIAPIGGSTEILYDCSPASGTGFGTCTFRQECSLGCKRVPPSGGTFHDFCASSGPNAVTLDSNDIVSGDRVPASIVAEAPAGAGQDQEQGVPGLVDPNFNAIYFPQQGGIGFPTGASSVAFDVATSYVPSIQFVDVKGFWFNASIPPFLITNGRGGHAWLVMLPPEPAPPSAVRTLGDFKITGTNPVTGGKSTFGQIDLSGLSAEAGPTITLTSSHPAIVPSTSVVSPASDRMFGYQAVLSTQAPAADTDVTITASDGRYSFSKVLRVLKPPPPPVLAGVSVNPASVVGGNPSIGTVTLSAPQSGTTVVALSTPAPATVATMPSSVTLPAGATSASFTIVTRPVSSQFNMNVFASLSGSPGKQALLLITAGSSPPPAATLSSVAVNPSSVVGGSSSNGTVTLSAAAPSGGAAVSLFDNSIATSVPASVTVPAGATSAGFTVSTTSVTASTSSTISAAWGGVTRTAPMMVTPATSPAPAALSAVSVNPASVVGGNASQGTVTLTAAAPSGGFAVALSDNSGAATVPASLTVAQGSTSATFTVTTTSVGAPTPVTITASAAGVTRTAGLTVTPAGGQTATLTVTAAGRSGERVTSSPAGINVAVGGTGSASFATGTSITLSVTNGRDAIWSGACSSGGNKRRSCTFTLNAAASVSASVQ